MNNGHDFQLVPEDKFVGIHHYEKYRCTRCGYWYIWNVDKQCHLHWEVLKTLAAKTCEEMLVEIVLEK